MKKNFLYVFFLFPAAAFATSFALEQKGHTVAEHCDLAARFLGTSVNRRNGGRGKASNFENAVYWKLEVVDANGAQCPKGRSLSLRIRSADFMGSSSAPVITYPVDIVEPKLNEVARLRVKFIQGTNTFLNRRYSEWLLEERLND